MKVLLTYTPEMRKNYYGERALRDLLAIADVRLHEGREALDPAALIAAASAVEVIVADRMTAVPAEVFAGLPKLKAVVRGAVDIRNIDVAAASAHGVLVTRAGAGFVKSVAEMTIGYLVDLARGISRATAAYHAGSVPGATLGRQLAGSTAGIIGYGAIARYLAPILAALEMTVVITDPYARVEDARFAQLPFEELLAKSDYVVCLALATEETENLIDAGALARMKPSAYFLNLSRGNLVDEAALESALRAGGIAGAAMDVGRAPDQMPSPHLAALPNVIATPHSAGLTPPAIEYQALETVRQVAELVAGKAPPGAVNEERWTRRT